MHKELITAWMSNLVEELNKLTYLLCHGLTRWTAAVIDQAGPAAAVLDPVHGPGPAIHMLG
jgi:hypothetical protein